MSYRKHEAEMTKEEIIDEIMSRLNLTSTTARARIGTIFNRYYLRVTTAIGMAQISRREFDVEGITTIASAEVEFALMEKITRVFFINDNGEKAFLDEVTIDELRDEDIPSGDMPSRYAMKSMGSESCTIYLDQIAETEYSLFADGYIKGSLLEDEDEPVFPESFHDVMVEGPLVDEYKKLKDGENAKGSKLEYEQRMSDLKHWAGKTAYLKIRQGQRPRGRNKRRDNSGVPF